MARTETVTVVFSDLVGSTELASRLGHDAYEAVRHEHFRASHYPPRASRGIGASVRVRTFGKLPSVVAPTGPCEASEGDGDQATTHDENAYHGSMGAGARWPATGSVNG